MKFRRFLETTETFQKFCDDYFVGEFDGLHRDFYCWIKSRELEEDNYDYEGLKQLFLHWMKSKARGQWCQKWDRKRDRRRRADFGPGKYWAPTSAGVFLNKNFVKGWRGINPVNP